MVRIIEKDPADIEREDKIERLRRIARRELPLSVARTPSESYLYVSSSPWYLLSIKRTIHVHLGISLGNRIIVKHPSLLNRAVKLAQAFEDAGEGPFTVGKDYREPTRYSPRAETYRTGSN